MLDFDNTEHSIRVLAIDPATLYIGVAVAEFSPDGFEVLRVEQRKISPKIKIAKRYVELYEIISDLLDEYEPDYCAVEDVRFSKYVPNIGSMLKVSRASGTVQLAMAHYDEEMPVYPIFATRVRKLLEVKTKDEVRQFVNERFKDELASFGFPEGVKPKQSDISDALAIAYVSKAHAIAFESFDDDE